MSDLIDRQAAIDEIQKERHEAWEDLKDDTEYRNGYDDGLAESMRILIDDLPSVQPEPISVEYAKAVRSWLVNYQVKCAELQGRYTPYEVLGWIVSDWRKENEIW